MKLLLENVYSGQDCDVKLCLSLFVLLGTKADLKTLQSFETVENFLKSCLKGAATAAFGDQQRCKICENTISGQPIQLQCANVICVDCKNNHLLADSKECGACHETHGMEENTPDSDKLQVYNKFKNNCNNFFMEIVSQLCFADDEAPANEVIKKLVSFITVETRMDHGMKYVSKEMALFESKADSTPVFRSFLLQHLLRTSSDVVTEFLDEYLSKAKAMLNQEPEKVVEFSLLVIQCLEDSFQRRCSKEIEPWKAELRDAKKYLKDNIEVIGKENLDVRKLYSVAETRFSLACTAKFLYQQYVEKSIKNLQILPIVYEAASTLTDRFQWAKLFFIKYFCRQNGVKCYRHILSSTSDPNKDRAIALLSMPELKAENVKECHDRFVVCGTSYKELRDRITQCLVDGDIELGLQGLDIPDTQKTLLFLLVIFREVTMTHVYDISKRRFRQEAVQKLLDAVEDEKSFHPIEKTMISKIAKNTLWTEESALFITEEMPVGDQDIVSLLHHVFFSVVQGPGQGNLLEPFIIIIQKSEILQNCFLPTMDEIDIEEIRGALANATDYGSLPAYKCPNGHLYLVGDCGRPVVGQTTCPECGAKIGGQQYNVLEDGNEKVDLQKFDEEFVGHILGRVSSRQDVGTPQRDLSTVNCAILRFFTNAALYLAASQNPESVKVIIKPAIELNDVLPFLMGHVKMDLTVIQRATGRSEDDIYLLLHRICHSFTEKHESKSKTLSNCETALSNKNDRRCWEREFSEEFFCSVLKELESELKILSKELTEDQRLGSDPLLRLIYETDSSEENVSLCKLHEHPAVWGYRSRISMDHLSNTFTMQIPAEKHAVIRIFLKEEHNLRVIRLVPSIIKLQKLLIHKYARRLDRREASSWTIQDEIDSYKEENDSADDLQLTAKLESKWTKIDQLVSDFIEAWHCIRTQLANFRIQTSDGIKQVSEKYHGRDLVREDPMSLFLPTMRDQGLCSYGLLYFLLRVQNTFLEEYCGRNDFQFGKLPRVKVSEVTHAHLISYHPDRDLLPMVMSNCQYTFEVGRGTKVEYNFSNLERQLMDRFLFSKSVIDLHPREFYIMTYRLESTNAAVFQELRHKIKQEPLNQTVATQISHQFRRYQDICDAMDKLDTVIRFLRSVGDDESCMLEEFMRQALRMDTAFLSLNIRKSCQCKHVQSLWLKLSMMKTKHQASNKKDVLEGVSDAYREELTDNQKEQLNDICDGLSKERLSTVLDALYECIILTIDGGTEDGDGENPMARYSIRDTLIAYVGAPAYDVDVPEPEWIGKTLQKFPGNDEDSNCIKVSQSMDLWICIYANYAKRKN